MMKKWMCFFLFPLALFGQKVEVLQKFDTLQHPKYVQFVYLHPQTDSTASLPVAVIKATGEVAKPDLLYQFIRAKSQQYGGNSYRFKSYKREGDLAEIILAVYFSNDALLQINEANFPQNQLFVLGATDLTKNKKQAFKIDGSSYEIGTGQYMVFDLPEGKELKVSKGGFTGTALWLLGTEGQPANFLSFSGIGFNDAATSSTGMGISVSTGKIHRVDADLACLLLHVFEKK